MDVSAVTGAVRAYLAARWRSRRLHSRAVIARYQQRQLARLMADAARDLPFYQTFAERPFTDWPVIDKAALLAEFARINRAGLSAEQVRQALGRGEERLGDHLIGMSTGTSGNRGYYVITQAERFVWLGTILAKALPDALWRRHKVALALPALSDLYRSASLGSRIELRFFDLARGPEAWINELRAFAPDTIVAPPKVLRWLAERDALGAERIFSGAEVLDPIDRSAIEAATGRTVRQIYMATEGLFAVSCPHATLHLAEDVVHFEFERPDPASELVTPLVTDFTRRAQGMIRYRMNDLIELSDAPCPCGSAFQALRHVEGRSDDAFLLPGADGALRMVTPDVLRNSLLDAEPAIRDFRITQTGANEVAVQLEPGLPAASDGLVKAALEAALARRGLTARIGLSRGITPDFSRKLRRVSRAWQPPD
jgi:putative adenylate-forming enzyme